MQEDVLALRVGAIIAAVSEQFQAFFGRHRFTLAAVADGTRLVDEEVFTGAMAEAVLDEPFYARSVRAQAASVTL